MPFELPTDIRLGESQPERAIDALKQLTNGRLDEYIQRRKQLVKELTDLNYEIARLELIKQIGIAFNATTD